MRVQLAQQAQDLLGQNDLVIITERVDDVALLIGQMVTMGFVEVLDRHLPRHWTQRRLSWGWTVVIWLRFEWRCLKPTVSPPTIPLVYCPINSFQRAPSVEKPWPGGEKRRDGWAS